MTAHDTYLQLAATAVDYPLAASDRGRLEAHLAGCPACARRAHAFRGDALALGHLPRVTLPERRGSEILAAALHPQAVRNPLRLLVLAALLGLLLVGSLAVGAQLLRTPEEDLGVVLPVPSASPVPEATPAPSASPVPERPAGRLVVTHDGWVEIVSLDGAAPQRVNEGSHATWIREGQLAFTCLPAGQETSAVCATDPESGDVFTLMESADSPAANPEGSRLVIHRGTIDVGETWRVVMDSDVVDRLSAGDFHAWSPDGEWLAGQPESAANEVAMVSVDGEGLRVLASGYDPAWSPSGDQIASVLVESEQASLRVFDMSTDEIQVLYEAPAGSQPTAPAWLPGGALVFAMDGDLWRLDPASTEPVALTTGLAVDEEPPGDELDVSPDGRWIAFTNGSGTDARVGIASVDGGWEMLDLGDGAVSQPRWAPGLPTGPETPSVSPDPNDADASPAAQAATLPIDAYDVGDVAGFDEGYVAITRGVRTVWFSPDGRRWEAAQLPFETTESSNGQSLDADVRAIASDGQRLLVVGGYSHEPCRNPEPGSTGGGPECPIAPLAWISDDGRTWRSAYPGPSLTLPPGYDQGGEFTAAWAVPSGGWDAAVGYWQGAGLFGRTLMHSADGLTWTPIADAPGRVGAPEDPPWTVGGVADWTGRRLLWEHWDGYSALAESADGSAWTPVDGFAGDNAWVTTGIAPLDDGLPWLLGGARAPTADEAGVPTIWASGDGEAWTAIALPMGGGTQGRVDSVVKASDGYVAWGVVIQPTPEDDEADRPAAWFSRDGRTWAEVSMELDVKPALRPLGFAASGPAGVLAITTSLDDVDTTVNSIPLR